MEKTPAGIIRKIIIGTDPKAAMAYELGKEFSTPKGTVKITLIEEDQSNFYFFGNIRYNIWVKVGDKQEQIWKFYEKMSVCIEYQL